MNRQLICLHSFFLTVLNIQDKVTCLVKSY